MGAKILKNLKKVLTIFKVCNIVIIRRKQVSWYNWNEYNDDVDRIQQRAEQQDDILDKAGLSDADPVKQGKYMDDYWAMQRQKEGYQQYKEQCERDREFGTAGVSRSFADTTGGDTAKKVVLAGSAAVLLGYVGGKIYHYIKNKMKFDAYTEDITGVSRESLVDVFNGAGIFKTKKKRKELEHGDFIRDKNGKFTMIKKQ
ncbi:MAG: hypothetical protein LBP19_00220 [Treponema sp.]|jgi:hypothetical protein|nr:hypothetical protein [Treponema sp.]